MGAMVRFHAEVQGTPLGTGVQAEGAGSKDTARVKRESGARGGNNVGNAAKVRGVVNQGNEHRRP